MSVQLFEEGVRWSDTVTDDGTFVMPLCGALDVASASVDEVCARAMTCLRRYYRRPLVHVEIEAEDAARVSAGCEDVTAPLPTEPSAEMQQVLAVLPAADLDAALMRQLIEAVTSLDEARERKTDEHPDVAAGKTRVTTLLAALPGRGGPDDRALLGRWLAQRQQALALLREELTRKGLGEKHPRHVALVLAQDRYQRVRDALGNTPELEVEIWADAVESGVQPPAGPTIGCAARRAALDRRIAYWRGRAAEGETGGEAAALDALAMARAHLECSEAQVHERERERGR
jgi:hypothetical protein